MKKVEFFTKNRFVTVEFFCRQNGISVVAHLIYRDSGESLVTIPHHGRDAGSNY